MRRARARGLPRASSRRRARPSGDAGARAASRPPAVLLAAALASAAISAGCSEARQAEAVASADGVVVVRISTGLGEITAEVEVARAPVTAGNFLAYVDEGVFDGGTFYRSVRSDNQPDDSVRIEAVQAGVHPSMRPRLRPPIALERTSETGLAHVDGALSMARAGPDTGRASFFIAIGDQPSLDFGGRRNPDGQGFAVFGRVTSGMDVVRRIQAGEVRGQRLSEPVTISSIRRAGSRPAQAVLAAVQDSLDALAAAPGLPGLTLGVAFADGTSAGFAAGWADTVARTPLRPTDRMLQGSVGKTYFAAVALQLASEGALDLDAPLSDYLGDLAWLERVPNGREATVRQLMSHTSGIVRYELDPAFLRDLAADPMRSFTAEDRLSYLFDTAPAFAPGAGWEYSDTNFILVAMVIERLTGRTAYDEIRRRLLEPLGLRDTTPSSAPEVMGLTNGYAGPDNPFGAFDATMAGGRLAFNPQFEWGGGGFASTAQDLARWIRDVHEGRAFDPALLGAARTGTHAPLGPQGAYGLGVIMMELPSGTAWGHSGFMPGYRTEAYYFPRHGLAVALQTNTSDGGALPESPLRILDGLVALLTGG